MFRFCMCVSFLLWYIISPVFAQSPEQNLDKYWHYRSRLIGNKYQAGFVDIGIEQGQSLPATERYPDAHCNSDWYVLNKDCKPNAGKGRLHWGDATLYLGHYMAILALEYKNLERAQQATDSVARELWYALEALERLDSLAEVVIGLEGSKNGFFLRDDVYNDFYIKPGNRKERRFVTDSFCFECITSAYNCGTPSVEEGTFISQDQVIGLLVGFMTIHQLISDHRYQAHLPTFGEKVALNMDRIASYMLQNRWKLRDSRGNPIPDKWGGNAIGLSYPIASLANYLTARQYRPNYLINGAQSTGKFIYNMLHLSLGFQGEVNSVLAMTSMALLNDKTNKRIAKKSINNDMVIYALLHAVLFRQPLSDKISREILESYLDTAPYEGPCFNTLGCTAPDGWKSYNRWVHPDFKNGNPYGVHSETPGLDYMLLYNLYHYYYYTDLPVYTPPYVFTEFLRPVLWRY